MKNSAHAKTAAKAKAIGMNHQFSKTPGVLRGMGLTTLKKDADALEELREKGKLE